jgi:hypothetical protein
MIAQANTKYFWDHPEFQKASPFVAFNAYLERGARRLCINAARECMGLMSMNNL